MRILFSKSPINTYNNMMHKTASDFSLLKNTLSSDVVSFSKKVSHPDADKKSDKNYFSEYDTYTPASSYQISDEEGNGFLHDFLTNFNHTFARKYMFQFSGALSMDVITTNFVRPRYRDYQTELCENAGIDTIDDYLKTAHIFNSADCYKVFENSAVDFFKIYSVLDDKYDLERFPEFLYFLNLKAEYIPNCDKKEFFNSYTKILNKLNINSCDELHTKFRHLSHQFNSFETFDDDMKVLKFIEENYDEKMDVLKPISEKFSSNKRLETPEKIYAQVPDIVDYIIVQDDNSELQDFYKYAAMAVSSEKFSYSALLSIANNFNSFQTPQDKILFFKKLNRNNVSISEFNKLYEKPVVEFENPISKLNNMSNIVDYISNKGGFNKQKAREFYLKFADVLNSAYVSETTNFDVLSETVDFIKRYKIADSKQFLNVYNNCNASKNNSIKPKNVEEFIDLMRFADNTIQINKKYKKSIFEDLEKTKIQFLSIKDQIDNFLLSKGEEVFVSESSLSIFNKYKKHLANSTPEQINKKLNEIVKFNVQNSEEYSRIIQELKCFSNYFESKEALYKFISDNDVPFEIGSENEEYRENCLYLLGLLYDENDRENSLYNIQKLSDSKFLLKSKTSLTSFRQDYFLDFSHKDILKMFVDKQVPSYQTFKEFYSFCRTNKSSYSDLVKLIQALPEEVSFSDYADMFRTLQEQILQTNYPIKLDVSNANNLTVNDILSVSEKFNPVIINKLLGCDENINPASCIHNTKTYYMDDIDGLQVAIELANEQYSNGEKYDDLFRILELDKQSLGLSQGASKFLHINAMAKNIPDQFMKFVNSVSKINDKKNYNMSIHSVLRLIDRFIAKDCKNINQLCSNHSLNKANDILSSVYEQCPYLISNDAKTHSRMIIKNYYNGIPITSIFSKEGKMITIYDDWQK